jgi:hypothetical protein
MLIIFGHARSDMFTLSEIGHLLPNMAGDHIEHGRFSYTTYITHLLLLSKGVNMLETCLYDMANDIMLTLPLKSQLLLIGLLLLTSHSSDISMLFM